MTTKKNTTADKFNAHALRLAEAQEQAEEARQAAEEARDYVGEVRGRIRALDPNVTAQDLLGAVSMVEFTNLRAEGAQRIVQRLKAEAPFEPIAAERVAAALTEAYGFPFLAVEAVPKEAPKDKPVAYVVQSRGAEQTWGGLSARVSITLVRDKFHRGLVEAEVHKALADVGIHGGNPSVTSETDRLTFAVKFALDKAEVTPRMLAREVERNVTPAHLVFDVEGNKATHGDMYR